MFAQIMDFFVTRADAAPTSAAPAAQGGGTSLMVMMVIIILFMYFMIWRPQSKRVKEQQHLMNSLAKGDEVMTSGGLLGRITKITGQFIVLTITNNVDIFVQKSAIVNVLPKGTIKSLE